MFLKKLAILILVSTVFACSSDEKSNNVISPVADLGLLDTNMSSKNDMKKMPDAGSETMPDTGKMMPDAGSETMPDTGKMMPDAGSETMPDAKMMACGLGHDSAMFSEECEGEDQMLIQKMASLGWVNGANGCHTKANLEDNADIMDGTRAGAIKFCDTLDYAGKMDWRLPTQDELSVMIKESVGKVTLNYINPNCKAMIATKGFVQTENTADAGKKIDDFGNFGVRCVRDIK